MSRRLTDDEMEHQARRNLADLEHDMRSPEISIGGEADDDPATAALEALDTTKVPDDDLTDDDLAALEDLEDDRSRRLDMIKRAAARYAQGGEVWLANRPFYYEAKAREARKDYAEKIMKEKGRPVRRYRQGIDTLTDEQRRALRAEQERERYRTANGGAVRSRQSLAGMSPEDRKAREADQAKERQRRKRIKDKS
ncbi:hypothetical protein [Mesorhizobium sp. Root172]|uniref:hypothetical protein n=1 Tax=Mesorhizobium sp. Root172 TaxID=1736481 RepID=UPI0006F73BFA|nr:hypothetical protein [Mesorhizobium sp. Root172]KRB31710.1 hypothetical protein ASE05_01255 [Mesorhizobium sp. Root172]